MRRAKLQNTYPATLVVLCAGIAPWLCAAVAGCDYAGSLFKPATATQAAPVEASLEDGSTKVHVRAAKGRIEVAEPVRVTLEVRTPEGVEVSFPEPGTKLGPFTIRDSKISAGVPIEGGRLWTQTLELETYRSGGATIPPIDLTVIEAKQGGIPVESKLSTPELSIEVQSALPADADPTQYEDIKDVVALPGEGGRAELYLLLACIGVVILALVGLILWQRRRRRLVEARLIPPHEYASQRLRTLREHMPTTDEAVHEFYFELTAIVREYIENRFDIRAVEQTTREFLEAARRHPALSNPAYSGLLAGFLIAGDLVKFAKHLPDTGEIKEALNAAETFVTETAPLEREASKEAAA
jgi:hypothetical protein